MAKRGKSKKDKKKEKDEQVGGESQVGEEVQGEDTSENTEAPVAETAAEEAPVAETAAEEAPVAEIAAEEAEVLEPAEEVEELWICSKCNRENRGKSRFCSGCGESKIKEEGPVDDQGKPRVVYADLIIYDSKGNSKRVSLLNERITIGRVDPLAQIYPDIDLTFFDSEQIVSRRHCEIFQKPPGQYFLVDIGSSNGTFLNRKKIQKGVSLLLNDNDEVHFAKTRTIFSQSLD